MGMRARMSVIPMGVAPSSTGSVAVFRILITPHGLLRRLSLGNLFKKTSSRYPTLSHFLQYFFFPLTLTRNRSYDTRPSPLTSVHRPNSCQNATDPVQPI